MMRRIVHFGWLATALLLAALLAGFWWRSDHVMDEWSLVDEDNTLHAVVSFRGSLHVIKAGKNSTKRPLGWDTQQIGPATTITNLHKNMGIAWQRAGFIRVSSAVPPPALPAPAPVVVLRSSARPRKPTTMVVSPAPTTPPPVMTAIAPWLLTHPYDAWVIPYWAPVLAVGLVPAILSVFGIARHFVRRHRGRCDACGYDLRASPERCPECGYPIRQRRRAHVPDGTLDPDATPVTPAAPASAPASVAASAPLPAPAPSEHQSA